MIHHNLRPDPGRSKQALEKFVAQWQFDRFVTLTFNKPGNGRYSAVGSDTHIYPMKDKLRAWDARMNRKLIGHRWAELHDFRTFSIYTMEKSIVNPHWHGLIQFFNVDAAERRRQGEVFDKWASRSWRALVPTGDVDVKVVTSQEGAIDYVAKSLIDQLNWEHFVLPDEFGGR